MKIALIKKNYKNRKFNNIFLLFYFDEGAGNGFGAGSLLPDEAAKLKKGILFAVKRPEKNPAKTLDNAELLFEGCCVLAICNSLSFSSILLSIFLI